MSAEECEHCSDYEDGWDCCYCGEHPPAVNGLRFWGEDE